MYICIYKYKEEDDGFVYTDFTTGIHAEDFKLAIRDGAS